MTCFTAGCHNRSNPEAYTHKFIDTWSSSTTSACLVRHKPLQTICVDMRDSLLLAFHYRLPPQEESPRSLHPQPQKKWPRSLHPQFYSRVSTLALLLLRVWWDTNFYWSFVWICMTLFYLYFAIILHHSSCRKASTRSHHRGRDCEAYTRNFAAESGHQLHYFSVSGETQTSTDHLCGYAWLTFTCICCRNSHSEASTRSRHRRSDPEGYTHKFTAESAHQLHYFCMFGEMQLRKDYLSMCNY